MYRVPVTVFGTTRISPFPSRSSRLSSHSCGIGRTPVSWGSSGVETSKIMILFWSFV
jgi:hypothetical protein